VISFLLTIVLAVLAVVATKGSFRRLGRLKFRLVPVLLIGLFIQIPLDFWSFPKDRIEDVGLGILLLTYAMILAFCYANRSTRGMPLIAIGIILNVLVIALNQGMPTKDYVREVDGHTRYEPIEQTVKHRPEQDGDLLGFLGDVITLPGFPNQQFSIGDIVISIGIIDLCFEGSRVPRRRGQRPRTPQAQQS
jgi:hypothetical protein